jgi:hypothetical protein
MVQDVWIPYSPSLKPPSSIEDSWVSKFDQQWFLSVYASLFKLNIARTTVIGRHQRYSALSDRTMMAGTKPMREITAERNLRSRRTMEVLDAIRG